MHLCKRIDSACALLWVGQAVRKRLYVVWHQSGHITTSPLGSLPTADYLEPAWQNLISLSSPQDHSSTCIVAEDTKGPPSWSHGDPARSHTAVLLLSDTLLGLPSPPLLLLKANLVEKQKNSRDWKMAFQTGFIKECKWAIGWMYVHDVMSIVNVLWGNTSTNHNKPTNQPTNQYPIC